MRVRACLALAVDARPDVLNESGGLSYVAVRSNREHSHASAGVVCDQGVLTGVVVCDVAGVGSARGNFVEERQLAGLAIDGEGGYCAAVSAFIVLDFIRGIQEAAAGVDREE